MVTETDLETDLETGSEKVKAMATGSEKDSDSGWEMATD